MTERHNERELGTDNPTVEMRSPFGVDESQAERLVSSPWGAHITLEYAAGTYAHPRSIASHLGWLLSGRGPVCAAVDNTVEISFAVEGDTEETQALVADVAATLADYSSPAKLSRVALKYCDFSDSDLAGLLPHGFAHPRPSLHLVSEGPTTQA